jgi:hypothetical protein
MIAAASNNALEKQFGLAFTMIQGSNSHFGHIIMGRKHLKVF